MDVILLAIALGGLKVALTMLIKKRSAITEFADEEFATKEAKAVAAESAAVTSLCSTCASAHIVTGYREAEMVVICTEANHHIPIRFEVKDCTGYSQRNRAEPAPVIRKFGFFSDESATTEEEHEMAAINT
jgi:hypothetical protein